MKKRLFSFLILFVLLFASCAPSQPEMQSEPKQEETSESEKQEEPKKPKSLAAEEPPALNNPEVFTYHKQYDGSMAVQAEDWIYYIGKRTNWLARVKTDGSGYQKLYTNTEADMDGVSRLAVWGEYVYFDGYPGNLKRISVNGGEPEDLGFKPSQFILTDGWIYYDNGGTIYRYRCADGFHQQILENPNSENFLFLQDVDGDTLYFSFYDDLYCCTLSGSDIRPITLPMEKYDLWKVQDGWVYYENDHTLYRCHLDSTEKQRLAEPSANGFLIRGEWLYYDFGRCRVKTDGSEQQELISEEEHFIVEDRSLWLDWDLVGGYCYLGLQVDDANWYDMVRYPLAELEKGRLSGGQHTETGPWEFYDRSVYDDWMEDFYNPSDREEPYY